MLPPQAGALRDDTILLFVSVALNADGGRSRPVSDFIFRFFCDVASKTAGKRSRIHRQWYLDPIVLLNFQPNWIKNQITGPKKSRRAADTN